MKKLIFAFLLILGANAAYAQSTQNRTSATATVSATVQVASTEQLATMETNKMAKELNLTSDQMTKIQEVNVNYATQMNNIAQAGTTTSPERTVYANKYKNDQYKNILTAEQYAKFEKMSAE